MENDRRRVKRDRRGGGVRRVALSGADRPKTTSSDVERVYAETQSWPLREETQLNTTAESREKLSESILIGFRHRAGRLPLRGCV